MCFFLGRSFERSIFETISTKTRLALGFRMSDDVFLSLFFAGLMATGLVLALYSQLSYHIYLTLR